MVRKGEGGPIAEPVERCPLPEPEETPVPSLPTVEPSLLLRALDVGYLIQDISGAPIDADPRTRQLLGSWSPEHDPLEGCVDEGRLPLPADRRPVAVALLSPRPVRGVVLGLPDRSERSETFSWIRVDCAVLDRDADGAPVSVVSLLVTLSPEETMSPMVPLLSQRGLHSAAPGRTAGGSAGEPVDLPPVPGPRTASWTARREAESWIGYGQSWNRTDEAEQEGGVPGAVPSAEPAGPSRGAGPARPATSRTPSPTAQDVQHLGQPGEVTGRLDSDGRFIEIAGPVRDLFGLAVEEVLGRSLAGLVHAETTDRLHAALAAAWIADGGKARVRCRRSDGELRWVELYVHRERRDDPEAEGEPELRIVIQDVHQQVSTAPSPDQRSGPPAGERLTMVSMHDPKGKFRYVSPTASRLLGHRSEALVGRDLTELVHPEDRGALVTARERASKGEPVTVEYRMLRADASWQPVVSQFRPVLDIDGSMLEFQANTSAGSQENRPSGPMRRSTDTVYSKALECVECGVAQLSPDGRFLRMNDKMVELLGQQRIQAEGRSMEVFLAEQDRGLTTRLRRELVRGHQDLLRTTVTIRRNDGSTVPANIELTPVRDEAGVVHGVIAKARQREVSAAEFTPRAHDRLTAAGTPVLLRERAEEILAQGRKLALMEVSVDGMRRINEERGRNAGDQILVTLVQRLRSGTRTGDTVIRMRDDRFVALCPDVDAEQIEPVAQRLCRSLAAPVEGIGSVTVSVGATTWRLGDTLESLLQRVAGQIEAVKRAGGAGWALA
jgi:diguanylate cyclase (GGDEF)-like protein/PAS domain S-box-containing protein